MGLFTPNLGIEVINSIESTEPANEPVSLADFKTYAKIDYTTDDTLITSLLKAARKISENYTKRKTTTSTITIDYLKTSDRIYLPFTPVISVTSINTLDKDDTATLLVANTDYYVNGDYIEVPDHGKRLKVIYTAGYGANATDVPDDFVSAIKELTLQLYEQRGSYDETEPVINRTVKVLLHNYKRFRI